ncbi:hypothetical protein SLEP1_g51918 [Rubroshorea leprosula]|uniref:PGG domain-containing protein n=1 Tax=Rubroshorea leprosula TaxID=152421 RepID=A0AAV5M6B7_9ROSI|nr:hypothetical protein SLEP1_g51918 [Rubroshorea leprosula]
MVIFLYFKGDKSCTPYRCININIKSATAYKLNLRLGVIHPLNHNHPLHLNAEIKRIYDLKLTHVLARETQRLMCKQISTWGIESYKDEVAAATFEAIASGKVDFVVEMMKFNPRRLTTVKDGIGRNILLAAIAFRQEEIAKFIYESNASKSLIGQYDNYLNSLLHVAGQMAPSVQLHGMSSPALQMQKEVQWYKVENISVYSKETINVYGLTPHKVFTSEHKQSLFAADKWMKFTAGCYTVVGTLIITIMFAAAFTIPGGNNQETGLPLFINRKAFKIYMIFDAVSLCSASTSVVTFLGILTSSYNIEDFDKYAPTKLIVGLSSLFISVAAMMTAFCLALLLMLQRRWWILIPCMLLAGMPVTLFVLLQFPLLVEIFNLTYCRSPIFLRKRSVT